jgi:hypothetical protein
MVLVIMHAELAIDHNCQATRGPASSFHAMSLWPFRENTRKILQLIRCKAARPAGCATFLEGIHSFMEQRMVPTGSRCPAYAVHTGNPRL